MADSSREEAPKRTEVERNAVYTDDDMYTREREREY